MSEFDKAWAKRECIFTHCEEVECDDCEMIARTWYAKGLKHVVRLLKKRAKDPLVEELLEEIDG